MWAYCRQCSNSSHGLTSVGEVRRYGSAARATRNAPRPRAAGPVPVTRPASETVRRSGVVAPATRAILLVSARSAFR